MLFRAIPQMKSLFYYAFCAISANGSFSPKELYMHESQLRYMQAITKASSKIMGRICENLNVIGDHKITDNSKSFLPVHAEVINHVPNMGFNNKGADLISIAHYVKENGDSIADPEICFIRCTEKDMNKKTLMMEDVIKYYPYSIKYLSGKEIFCGKVNDEGRFIDFMHLTAQKDIAAFANIWMRNIKEQQF